MSLSHEDTRIQIVHPEVDKDGNSQPKDTLIRTRRALLTNFGLGSIATSAALLIGTADIRSAVARTGIAPLGNDKDKEPEVCEFPDLLVIFDPASRITLVGLATEDPENNLVTFSAMAIGTSPIPITPIIEFRFGPEIIQRMEELPVDIPGISMIDVEELGTFKLKVDLDPMNEDVASGTLIDPITRLHVDFLVRQFELQSPFGIPRFLRRAVAAIVSVAVLAVTAPVGGVWITPNWIDCVGRAIEGCGQRNVRQTRVVVTVTTSFPRYRIDCEITCMTG